MRIIAGSLKGRKLVSPGPDDQSIRPTSDRAREALFSILQAWPQGGFLDLFAGTGAVGIEAWSRGYWPVISLDKSFKALFCVTENARETDVRILRVDAAKGIHACGHGFSVIFADPPYAESAGLFERMSVDLGSRLSPQGVLVWETDRRTELVVPSTLDSLEDRSYGTVRFRFFQACRK